MISYALIGCGRISQCHLKAAFQNGITPIAVCDLVPECMEKALSAHSVTLTKNIQRFTDYREMLATVRPTLVAIATESGNHATIALDCIAAGCHAIIEKPIALSLKDADKMIVSAQEKGVLICANHQNRFNASIQSVRAAIDEGKFGTISHGTVHVRWNRGRDYYAQAPWRGTWAQDGGALMNQSIHGIDLLRWVMGEEIDEVFAYTSQRLHGYLECEDVGLALVKFKNGAIGTIEGTTNIYPHNLEGSLFLFGGKGTVKVGGKAFSMVDCWRFEDEENPSELSEAGTASEDVYGNGHTPLYTDMLDAITNNRPPHVDGAAGRRALELVLAIYKSSATGLPVKFPLNNCSTLDFVRQFD